MNDRKDPLTQLSKALAERADEARSSVAAIQGKHHSLSAVVWRDDTLVTSAQSLSKRDSYEIAAAGGESRTAILSGADRATNIAALKLSKPLKAKPLIGRTLQVGELVVAYGADRSGSVRARLGIANAVGDAWVCSSGGRIDSRIDLDLRLGASEEGGPVFAADGGFVGMGTFGPSERAIAIPAATLERVIPVLLSDGHVARGWLGIALQPVAVPETFRDAAGQSGALMAMSVAADGPAAKAGVLAGDIVLSVDGHGTERTRTVMSSLGPESVGRKVDLKLIRGGAIQTLPLTVEARPNA
ncbi:MAG TPA: S1C family serine protease [Rhizomicrobium sp.]|jgi:S1-C subfamily serine protease